VSGDIKYQFNVDLDDPNNAHSVLHRLVCESGRASMSILEVGCSSGYVGATFVDKGHRVTGVEPDPAAAEAARAVLPEVHCTGISEFLQRAPTRQYDAILFGDVLEHLPDPVKTLRQCTPLLAPGGLIAISLPCATHGSIRAMLLEGRWDYADYGLLDRTHLRFFSRAGVHELFAAAGMQIERMMTLVQPVDTVAREYGMAVQRQTIATVEALAEDADVTTFQFVAIGKPVPGVSTTELLERNRAIVVEPAIPRPRIPGERSGLQRLRVWLLRKLIAGIARRRFRDAG
jgi:2-polyprenyl-3-methyl-5-hydroxy-6-metoxy-1,4-benzoquinol methylase